MVGKRYRIIETLGKGAFGTVYRAEVIGAGDFKKQVALKVLDYKGDAPEEIALRFRDEARILGLIRHRAVVGVDSLAELETGWAVVMEYVDGVNISVVVKYGLPPARVCIQIVEEVASALHAAWNTVSDESGEPLRLVHRDIKPANIRLTDQGQVKVLDFGVARAEFESREAHTQAMRFGSLRYMAPESFDGIEGHPTDVFALGIVFAELLAGQRLDEPPKNPDRYGAFLEKVREVAAARLAPTMKAKQFKAVSDLVCSMIAFEPQDRPDARTVERATRELASRLDGATLRDWSEDYVPALAEKLARRKAQKAAQDPTADTVSSAVLAEKTSSHRLDGVLPVDEPRDGAEPNSSRSRSVTIPVTSGVLMLVTVLVVLLFGSLGLWLYLENSGTSGVDIVTSNDPVETGPDDGVEDEGSEGDGEAAAKANTPASPDIGGGESEFVEFADPESPGRTIVIARSALEVAGEEIRVADPENSQRTIVIARSAVAASSGQASPEPEPQRTVSVTQTEPQPTQAVVPKPAPAPAPAPAPVISGGTVQVSGDASSVSFMGSTGTSYAAGSLPAGTYRIMATFPGQSDPIQAGNATVRDGVTTTVNCSGLMLRCSSK